MNTMKRIQAVGLMYCKAAADLQPGDVTVWNYGSCYKVASVATVSKAYVNVTMVNVLDGKVWTRRAKASFQIAVNGLGAEG